MAAQYLRRATFFVLDGQPIEEVMAARGWIPDQFPDAESWRAAVER